MAPVCRVCRCAGDPGSLEAVAEDAAVVQRQADVLQQGKIEGADVVAATAEEHHTVHQLVDQAGGATLCPRRIGRRRGVDRLDARAGVTGNRPAVVPAHFLPLNRPLQRLAGCSVAPVEEVVEGEVGAAAPHRHRNRAVEQHRRTGDHPAVEGREEGRWRHAGSEVGEAVVGDGVAEFMQDHAEGIGAVDRHGGAARDRIGVEPQLVGEIAGAEGEARVHRGAVGVGTGAQFEGDTLLEQVAFADAADKAGGEAAAIRGVDARVEGDLDFDAARSTEGEVAHPAGAGGLHVLGDGRPLRSIQGRRGGGKADREIDLGRGRQRQQPDEGDDHDSCTAGHTRPPRRRGCACSSSRKPEVRSATTWARARLPGVSPGVTGSPASGCRALAGCRGLPHRQSVVAPLGGTQRWQAVTRAGAIALRAGFTVLPGRQQFAAG